MMAQPGTFLRKSLLALAAPCALLAGTPVAAQQTVYRCADAAGAVGYQAEPCPAEGSRQKELRLPALPAVAASASRPQWKPYVAPRTATIALFYDTTNEPMEFPSAQMEAAIRGAAAAWNAGCHVNVYYAGRAPYRPEGTPERVSIRWMPDYLRMRHPAGMGGIAGTGSMWHGIAVTTRFGEGSIPSILVHELGHVLGLPHNHEDTQSVMSYLRDESVRRNARPSEADFLACNLSMKKIFGIDFTPPAGAPAPAQGPRMTDREAVEKLFGPKR